MKIALLHTRTRSSRQSIQSSSSSKLRCARSTRSPKASRRQHGTAARHFVERRPPGYRLQHRRIVRGKSALESNVAALLNLLDLRYTGSSPAGLILAGDKTLTKKVLIFPRDSHARSSPQCSAARSTGRADIKFPLLVKPPQEDASLGITQKSIVNNVKELLDRDQRTQQEYQAPVLVEEFIDGREFYVGVLGNSEVKALPIMEIDFSWFPKGMPKIASWEAKWGDDGDEKGEQFAGTQSVFPTDLIEELAKRIQQVAIDSFQALRLRDYARVDLRVTTKEEIYVIEVNPNCYLEKKSGVRDCGAEIGHRVPRADQPDRRARERAIFR